MPWPGYRLFRGLIPMAWIEKLPSPFRLAKIGTPELSILSSITFVGQGEYGHERSRISFFLFLLATRRPCRSRVVIGAFFGLAHRSLNMSCDSDHGTGYDSNKISTLCGPSMEQYFGGTNMFQVRCQRSIIPVPFGYM